jgi:hypothetical protein
MLLLSPLLLNAALCWKNGAGGVADASKARQTSLSEPMGASTEAAELVVSSSHSGCSSRSRASIAASELDALGRCEAAFRSRRTSHRSF